MAQEPRPRESLDTLLRALRLPACVELRAALAARGAAEGWSFEEYLYQLATHEIQDRKRRRIERLVKLSGVPNTHDRGAAAPSLRAVPTGSELG